MRQTSPLTGLSALAIILGSSFLESTVALRASEPGQGYWWQKPVRRPSVPRIDGTAAGWVRNPIDAFVLEKLAGAGVEPAPPASRTELIRRAFFDLTGKVMRELVG